MLFSIVINYLFSYLSKITIHIPPYKYKKKNTIIETLDVSLQHKNKYLSHKSLETFYKNYLYKL